MKTINIIKRHLHMLLFLIVLTICESYYISKALINPDNTFVLVSLSILFIAVLAILISSLPKRIALFIYILVGLGIGITIYFLISPIGLFLVEANKALLNREYIPIENPIILISAIGLLLLLINYIFLIKLKKLLLSVGLSIALFCILYFTYSYMNLVFAIVYLATVLILFLWWFSPQIKNTEKDSRKHSIVPIILTAGMAIFIAVLSVVVSNARPNPLQWIDDLDWFEGEDITPKVNPNPVIRIDSQRKLTNLSPDFNYSDMLMMKINTLFIDRLRGKTYDIYNKDGWKKALSNTAPNQNYQMDIFALMAKLDTAGVPYTPYTMTVTLNAETQMLFAPLNSQVDLGFETVINKNPYDDLFVFTPLKTESIYTADAINIDFSSEAFISLISNSASDNIDNLDNYIDISSRLKDKIMPLAKGLTQNANNNYDRVKIIESYLASQFTYTLVPPDKPDDADFIEYFLFETKQGFCTHYASTMTLMLRSIDIPCRYVTGYLPDPNAIYEDIPYQARQLILQNSQGMAQDYNVLKRNSHAWVEVWFDDFGWLSFEPTSGFSNRFATAAGYKAELVDFENIVLYEEPKDPKSTNLVFIIIGSILLVALLATLGVRIYVVANRSDKEKLTLVWDRIKKIYYKKNKITKQNETAREFWQRADKRNEDMKSAVELYEFAVFSSQDLSDWQLIKMNKLYKKIKVYNKNLKKDFPQVELKL